MTIRQLYINILIGKIVLQKHKKTHSQFDKIENEDQSYLIGYLTGYGIFNKSTYKRKARLSVSSIEEYIIEWIKENFSPDTKIDKRIPVNNKRNIRLEKINMRKITKTLAVVLSLSMTLTMGTPVFAEGTADSSTTVTTVVEAPVVTPTPAQENKPPKTGFYKKAGKTYYYKNGKLVKNKYGYKIKNKYYHINKKGDKQTNECQNLVKPLQQQPHHLHVR